jgi:hypothetical protein
MSKPIAILAIGSHNFLPALSAKYLNPFMSHPVNINGNGETWHLVSFFQIVIGHSIMGYSQPVEVIICNY